VAGFFCLKKFWIRLSRSSANIEEKVLFKAFSIKEYIYKLFSEMKIYDTILYKKFSPILLFLEKEFYGYS